MGAPKKGTEKLMPRDWERRHARIVELTRLYEEEKWPVTKIAAHYDVSHRSVSRTLLKIGVTIRRRGDEWHKHCCEPGCVLPLYRIQHATNGSFYGKRCRLHWIVYRMKVNQEYNDKHLGRDESWLRRMRQLLARVQRINREVLRSLKRESPPATTSPDACRR
jgi:hypothetical protein